MNTARVFLTGSGITTSALGVGGALASGSPNATGATELWNGTSWTEVSDLNTIRAELTSTGVINTSVIAFGGYNPTPSRKTETELWDGSSWTEIGDLSEGRSGGAGSNSSVTSAFFAGGNDGSNVGSTEEFTVPVTNKTITVS